MWASQVVIVEKNLPDNKEYVYCVKINRFLVASLILLY